MGEKTILPTRGRKLWLWFLPVRKSQKPESTRTFWLIGLIEGIYG
jgi:hypothetical protein